jgi:cellulose biosynthesis protein BcsQ
MKKVPVSEFGKRLKEAFQNVQNKEIARRIGVSDPAVSGYMTGNFPAIEKLIEISELTGFTIDWLLTGKGEKFLKTKGRKFTSILVCGYKGGVGTSLSAGYVALSLAVMGKKVLVIDNKTGSQSVSFAPNPFTERDLGNKYLLTDENVCFQTDFSNIEIFLCKGFSYWSGLKERIKPFNKSIPQMREDYDFIVCDVPSYEDPFRCSDLTFNAILDKSKVLIPYEPRRSSIDNVNTILKFIDAETKLGFQAEFLGLFIAYERKNIRRRDYYLNEIQEVKNIIQDKMFNKVIKDVTQFGEIGELDHRIDLEEIKKTRLFKEYFKLTKEILSRITEK